MDVVGNLTPYVGVGIIFLIVGVIFKFAPVKSINRYAGYRTSTARASQENWDKANQYYPNIMIGEALVLIIVGIIFYLIFPTALIFQIVYMILSIFLSVAYLIYKTEKHIRS